MGQSQKKQNQLFLKWSDNEVHTISWFRSYGISNQLVQKYVKSGLIRKLGGGAYVKTNDELHWQGAVLAVQNELNLPIHVGGRSVFDLYGSGQYLSLGKRPTLFVIAREKIRMPIWLKQNDWGVKFQFKTSTLFKNDLGLETFKKSRFKIIISSRERAIMEMIDSLDLSGSFDTLEQYFEGLTNIRSELTQKLLNMCQSVKVKRIFLYVATRLNLPVAGKLEWKKINLGRGKRVVVRNGKLNKTFNITVPRSDSRGESL